jgi:hypothetical protein
MSGNMFDPYNTQKSDYMEYDNKEQSEMIVTHKIKSHF